MWNCVLTHFSPVSHFQGVQKCDPGLKWVNNISTKWLSPSVGLPGLATIGQPFLVVKLFL